MVTSKRKCTEQLAGFVIARKEHKVLKLHKDCTDYTKHHEPRTRS